LLSRRSLLGAALTFPVAAQAAKALPRLEEEPGFGKRYFDLPLVVSIPDHLKLEGGKLDVVVHFHGGHALQEAALKVSQLNAAVVSINMGISTTSYSRFVTPPKEALDRILSRTRAVAARQLGELEIGRVALAAWSAGFGAIRPLLADEAVRKRVDATLIADGLVTALSNVKKRTVHTEPLAGTFAFAEAATRTEKLLITSHSAIGAEAYASVAETTDALLSALSLAKAGIQDPKADRYRLLYEAKKGDFSALGYEGNSKPAHIARITQMGETMYKPLKARWQR
jgi:hypothetical protein